VGVNVEEVDEQHVRLAYDARERDQWHAQSTVAGDQAFLSGPRNWMLIHFDYGACGSPPAAG
jgi:hypothetical protein